MAALRPYINLFSDQAFNDCSRLEVIVSDRKSIAASNPLELVQVMPRVCREKCEALRQGHWFDQKVIDSSLHSRAPLRAVTRGASVFVGDVLATALHEHISSLPIKLQLGDTHLAWPIAKTGAWCRTGDQIEGTWHRPLSTLGAWT
jgi:hypothetical protein